jgi:hypothetical protein
VGVDDEWKRLMPTSQFAEVTAITWPQLQFYGYPLLPRARRSIVPAETKGDRGAD